jgi:hypothetical protein
MRGSLADVSRPNVEAVIGLISVICTVLVFGTLKFVWSMALKTSARAVAHAVQQKIQHCDYKPPFGAP